MGSKDGKMDVNGEAQVPPSWTWEQNKAFETSLATYSEDCIDRWQKIAATVPGKTVEEVKHHYALLEEDINSIESGLVLLPNYMDVEELTDEDDKGKMDGQPGTSIKSARTSKEGRRKGQPWTLDEHRLFLLGLEKYGKGDWRSISRNYVLSRTPTQVASHAQKYFMKQKSMSRRMRKPSILDITNADNFTTAQGVVVNVPASAPQQMASTGLGTSVSGSELSPEPSELSPTDISYLLQIHADLSDLI